MLYELLIPTTKNGKPTPGGDILFAVNELANVSEGAVKIETVSTMDLDGETIPMTCPCTLLSFHLRPGQDAYTSLRGQVIPHIQAELGMPGTYCCANHGGKVRYHP